MGSFDTTTCTCMTVHIVFNLFDAYETVLDYLKHCMQNVHLKYCENATVIIYNGMEHVVYHLSKRRLLILFNLSQVSRNGVKVFVHASSKTMRWRHDCFLCCRYKTKLTEKAF